MNALWIRVDAAIGGKDVVWLLAEYLRDSAGIPAEGVRDFRAEAVGFLVMFWGGVAQHADNGTITGKSDEQLEAWAGWRGEAGRFAKFIRETCVSEGRVADWDDVQGKLEERRRRDRERKAASKTRIDSAGIPQEIPRNSAATVRNGTLRRDVTKAAASTARTEKPAPPDERVEAVLAHYREKHPRRKPGSAKDLSAIRQALKQYSVDDLCTAIDGNAGDPWHAERSKHELTYVLRNSGLIDTFIGLVRVAKTAHRGTRRPTPQVYDYDTAGNVAALAELGAGAEGGVS